MKFVSRRKVTYRNAFNTLISRTVFSVMWDASKVIWRLLNLSPWNHVWHVSIGLFEAKPVPRVSVFMTSRNFLCRVCNGSNTSEQTASAIYMGFSSWKSVPFIHQVIKWWDVKHVMQVSVLIFFQTIIIKFSVICIHVFVVYFAIFGQSVAEIIQ